MDTRFFNIFGLTEDQAIALLKTPQEQLTAPTEHYVAVSHLINFPTERSIDALLAVIEGSVSNLYDRITRRKALESLGRLQAKKALPAVVHCLADEDPYTVENAVWAIGEIGTEDPTILEAISQLLDKSQQSYRIIIQTLAKLNYLPAVARIKKFSEVEDESISSAAITAICRLNQDYSQISLIVDFLQHSNVNVRRASIQDLIDAQYYPAIPAIVRCPVSIVFRLRGIRLLANQGFSQEKITFTDVESYLDNVILDHPENLDLVHEYDQIPNVDFLINELYHTDFGRCYLASKTLLEYYPQETPDALLKTWEKEAHNDYGAHYHVIKLLGWLGYSPAYNLLVEALQNTSPQFQKSRGAAAIALSYLGDSCVIPLLKEALNSKIFDLRYACLLALEKLGDSQGKEIVQNDPDWLISGKASS
jgi:bilin biosynthesis protein